MSVPAPRAGQCPSCGAAVEFKIGASRATVCAYCQAVVARKGQDFEAIGKVADLIPTGTQLALGSKGSLAQHGFEVVGRVQYEWKSGVWDEWYIGFTDGRWGWLAEAQGRFYVTFKVPPRPLPNRGVEPGASFFIEGLGRFTVSDVKQARVVGIQGELPDPMSIGDSPSTADMESEKGGFATLDLGTEGHVPAFYVGKQVSFESLNLGALPAGARLKQAKPSGQKLACPNCGAPITLRLPEQSVRVVCESCKNLIDTSQGAFRVIEAVERGKAHPKIPLGTQGTLRGRKLMVVGWMVRSCVVDSVRYPWSEYLLWDEKSQDFSWLVESDDHWQLATPVSVAGIHVADDALYKDRRFRHFSSVTGTVNEVLGEFYWEVRQGDNAQLDDYVAPPEGLSSEHTDGEVSWSHIDHLPCAEVAQVFGRPGLASGLGVGAVEPWPYQALWTSLSHWMLGGVAALFALVFFFALKPEPVYLDQSFNSLQMSATGEDAVGPGGERVRTFLSKPFDLSGHEALEVYFSSQASQSWVYAGGAVINEASGNSVPFGLESTSYSGYEDGESWSEGNLSASEVVASPGSGSTVVRADFQWDPKQPGPPNMRLKLSGESFSGAQFFVVLLLLLWPLFFLLHHASFEKQRWENSNVHWSGSSDGDD